ncbi:MAG: carboxypeptidase-like regulatory domain-containing protein, partial [Planctomycetota bacterium]|nr:carboxypeptidase-like regulatory domain-containing protein [Planctomycetota bacterium]
AEGAADALRAAEPTGPLVSVTDIETGHPVAGAAVGGHYLVPPSGVRLRVKTGPDGRVRLPAEPDSIHGLDVHADGYATRHGRGLVKWAGERVEEVHLTVGKRVVVEVTLVLPDERRAALSVYEGEGHDPAPRGLRARLEPKTLTVPVKWEDAPPKLPEHNPMLRLHLPSASPHANVEGVIHRVTAAQTDAGRELPVFRDAPPQDASTFGLYHVGSNGLGDAVFVIGTLADARAAEGAAMKLQWSRNDRVLGAATKPTTKPAAQP